MNKWSNNQNKLCISWEVIEFCSWQLFDLKSSCQRKLCLNSKNLNQNFQTTSDVKTTKIKVVGLEKFWNFVVDNFLIWNHLVIENYIWISQIWNSNFVINNLEWGNNQNKSCISQKVMKFCSWQLFYLNSFRTLNKQFALGLV